MGCGHGVAISPFFNSDCKSGLIIDDTTTTLRYPRRENSHRVPAAYKALAVNVSHATIQPRHDPVTFIGWLLIGIASFAIWCRWPMAGTSQDKPGHDGDRESVSTMAVSDILRHSLWPIWRVKSDPNAELAALPCCRHEQKTLTETNLRHYNTPYNTPSGFCRRMIKTGRNCHICLSRHTDILSGKVLCSLPQIEFASAMPTKECAVARSGLT